MAIEPFLATTLRNAEAPDRSCIAGSVRDRSHLNMKSEEGGGGGRAYYSIRGIMERRQLVVDVTIGRLKIQSMIFLRFSFPLEFFRPTGPLELNFLLGGRSHLRAKAPETGRRGNIPESTR